MYRGERSYADVVAEKGPRNCALMPIGKWARVVVCESKGKIRDWCDVGILDGYERNGVCNPHF